jgi:hypothetical protein
MAWNGSGTFQRTNGTFFGATVWQDDKNAGFDIIPSRVDTHDQDIATGINNCLTKDGQNSATAPLNLGGNKIYNAGAATLRTDLPQVAQVQDGDYIWLGTTGGSATAQTANATPAITAYKAGQKFRMRTGFASTGVSGTQHTININGLGTKFIVETDNSNPTLGTWGSGVVLELTYDGSNFVVTNNPGIWLNYTPVLVPAAGTITNPAFNTALYRKTNRLIQMHVQCVFNQTIASTTWISVSTPTNISTSAIEIPAAAWITANGTTTVGTFSFNANTTSFRVYAYDQQQITVANNKYVAVTAVYPCA